MSRPFFAPKLVFLRSAENGYSVTAVVSLMGSFVLYFTAFVALAGPSLLSCLLYSKSGPPTTGADSYGRFSSGSTGHMKELWYYVQIVQSIVMLSSVGSTALDLGTS